MKKNLVLCIVMTLLLILTGCAKGDIELEKSKGVKITYTDAYEQMTIDPIPMTEDEIFGRYCDTAVRGTIDTVRNIKFNFGSKSNLYKALMTLNVKEVLSGDVSVGKITVLLPGHVTNSETSDTSAVTKYYSKGVEGIFLLNASTDDSYAQLNGKTLYYSEICDYWMISEYSCSVISTNGDIIFSDDMFDDNVSFASLDEAQTKIQSALDSRS